MARQITPSAPSLPPTSAISDPAARSFAAAVGEVLRVMRASSPASGGLTEAQVRKIVADALPRGGAQAGTVKTSGGVTGAYEPADPRLQMHLIDFANPHDTTAEQVGADPQGTAADALTDHGAAEDPHPQYQTQSEADARYAKRNAAFALGDLTGAVTLTVGNGAVQYGTTTGATTWTFSGAEPAGFVSAFTLELTNGGAFAQTWPAEVKWGAGLAPNLTTSGLDILKFYSRDGGVTWRGRMLVPDSR